MLKALSLKKLRKWLLYGVGTAIMILMFWDLLFSRHGYFVLQHEMEVRQQLLEDIERLKAEKTSLQQEVIRLREDPKALEEVIHRELGYVYPDETMMIMPALPKKAGQKDKNQDRQRMIKK